MSSSIAIKVENLSKMYRLGQVGTGTLSHDLKRWWALTRGKEDPYLKIGQVNKRSEKGDSQYTWALKDISFQVNQGDVLGIVGSNGAGKSTLLKLLSRVTSPTEGRVKVKGRIASLLEVGTGFHPEMTGRENIYMNGAILGMSRHEIKRKFDDIVEFAGIAKYTETPVKRYSSGMYVRLAFAVAAHLESEILIVDEVLAVGDMEFQKKCLSKMNDISHNDGRTVLFVSHNLPSVQALCNRAISLEFGQKRMEGDTADVIADYLKKNKGGDAVKWNGRSEAEVAGKLAYFSDISLHSQFDNNIQMGDDIVLNIGVTLTDDIQGVMLRIMLHDSNEQLITSLFSLDFGTDLKLKKGYNSTRITVKKPNLLPGDYKISLSVLYNYGSQVYDTINDCITFTMLVADVTGTGVPFLSDRGKMWFDTEFVNLNA